MNPTLLTDRLLADLYFRLNQDYDQLSALYSQEELYSVLKSRLKSSIASPYSHFYYLTKEDRRKLKVVLDTLFEAKATKANSLQDKNNAPQDIKITKEHVYCNRRARLLDNVIINYVNLSHPYHGGYCQRGGYLPPQHQTYDNDNGNRLARVAVIIVSTIAVAMAAYAFNKSLEAFERFYYNEGWVKGCLDILSGLAGATLMSVLMTSPATNLALSAGLTNPAGWAAIVMGMIGYGVGMWLKNKVYQPRDDEAIDRFEPERFSLSQKEQQSLLDKGIDPIRVKCAIFQIKAELLKQQQIDDQKLVTDNVKIPSFTMRFFGYHADVQNGLNQIRQLRQGKYQSINVGGMRFNLNLVPHASKCKNQATIVNPYSEEQNERVMPSAPLEPS